MRLITAASSAVTQNEGRRDPRTVLMLAYIGTMGSYVPGDLSISLHNTVSDVSRR